MHEHIKLIAGPGVRFRGKVVVTRIGSAASDEGVEVQMMAAQPFQF